MNFCKCGKVALADRREAMSVAKTVGKRKPPRRRGGLPRTAAIRSDVPGEVVAYVCAASGMWHVGHKRKGAA